MKRRVVTTTVDDEGLAELRRPREAPARERVVDPDHLTLELGPFRQYDRRLVVDPQPVPDGRHRVTETTTWDLAVPLWKPLFQPVVRYLLKRPVAEGGVAWFPQLDARAATVLSLLCIFSVYAGYLGVLLSQTNVFFQREFGATNSEISDASIALRVGALAAAVVVAIGDRRGRRAVLIVSTYLAMLLAATGAFVPNLFAMTISQGVARVFSSAMLLLLLVVAAEELPAGARAFGVSMLTMSAALGAGGVVGFLWVGDLGPGSWRIFYLVPLPFLLTLPLLRRRLPESRRFEVYELREDEVHERAKAVGKAKHRRRLAIVASAGLCLAIFTIPTAAFTNNYLVNERGFAGWQVTIFQIITNVPGGISLIAGGLLADRFGRRLIGSIGIIGGSTCGVGLFFATGAWIWVFSTGATLLGALVIPALTVYQSELFPTGNRSQSNGLVNLFTVVGSVIGLKGAGLLSDHFGAFGPAMAILSVGALLGAIIVLVFYPETADRELEELNPEDIPPPADPAELAELDDAWRDHEQVHEHGRAHAHGHDRPHDPDRPHDDGAPGPVGTEAGPGPR